MIDPDRMKQVADAWTAAWNSGSAEAVAAFCDPDGRIVINGGDPRDQNPMRMPGPTGQPTLAECSGQ